MAMDDIRYTAWNEALEEAAQAALRGYEEREEDPDFDVYSYSGGNTDDAYSLGLDHGWNDVKPRIAASIRALKVTL